MSKSIEELKVSMFKQGDYVFLKDEPYTDLYVVTNILDDGRIELKTGERGYPVPTSCWGLYFIDELQKSCHSSKSQCVKRHSNRRPKKGKQITKSKTKIHNKITEQVKLSASHYIMP